MTRNVQAQPTQRIKTTSALLPRPSLSLASRSAGAASPTEGTLPVATGAGLGDSHGVTASGRLFMLMLGTHEDQPALSSSSSQPCGGPFLRSLLVSRRDGSVRDEKSNVSDLTPTFLRASLVERFASMVDGGGLGMASHGWWHF